MNDRCKIQGLFDEDNQETLYWNNDIGWVDEGAATIFDREEIPLLNMPEGAVALAWLRHDEETIHNIEPF